MYEIYLRSMRLGIRRRTGLSRGWDRARDTVGKRTAKFLNVLYVSSEKISFTNQSDRLKTKFHILKQSVKAGRIALFDFIFIKFRPKFNIKACDRLAK